MKYVDPKNIKAMFKKEPLRVLFVAAEIHPFSSVGGLSQVMHALSKAMIKIGVDVRIFTPKYGFIDEKKFKMKTEYKKLEVPTDSEDGCNNIICNVKKYVPDKDSNDPVVYFLENMEYYEKRTNVYGYGDDPVRFALLSKGVLEFLKKSDWVPHIINCNDWHTGACINYLKTNYRKDRKLSKIGSVFSIHNIYFQGNFDHKFVSEADFDDGKSPVENFFSERLNKQNFMKRGIIYADAVNTVSPNYSQEILTKEYGEGLEDLLKENRTKLFGILNGLDYESFNPKTDKNIESNFDITCLHKRKANKIRLQREFNLKLSEKIPLVGMVTRLDILKGIELLFPIMEILIKEFKIQFVIMGGGEASYREFFEKMAEKYPKNVGLHLTPDFKLPRHIFSGSDIFLVPSKFEPCGITQMEAMRYGSVPIVRNTGGLADTVTNFNPQKKEGNGFVFDDFSPYALFGSIVRALETYKHKDVWKNLIRRAMKSDFSWEASAKKYLSLYQRVLKQ